jgi:RNA polymerase sigma-70 factor (ECF subfamily)
VTSSDLLARAISGERAALEQLLLAQCTALSRHIAQKIPASLQSVLSVDDILQETLLQAFRNIQRFKPRTSRSFSVWLKTIAENQLNNAVKALTRQKRGGTHRTRATRPPSGHSGSLIDLVELLSDGRRTPSQSAMRREVVHVVQVAIGGLPPDQREAIELRFLEGRSLAETAVVMGRSTSAVRSLIHRAKRVLQDKLGHSSRWFQAN